MVAGAGWESGTADEADPDDNVSGVPGMDLVAWHAATTNKYQSVELLSGQAWITPAYGKTIKL